MTTKLRIKFEITVEYEANPSNYLSADVPTVGQVTPELMLAIDLQNANKDPFLMIDTCTAEWNITGEILPTDV